MNRWAIIDDKGIIYEGNEEEIKAQFDLISENGIELEIYGEIKLVEIHNVIH